MFAGQDDSAVGLLKPAGVSSGQVVKTPIDILAHGHDILKVLLSGQSEVKACLGQTLWKLGHSQAGVNLHLETTDEIQSGGDLLKSVHISMAQGGSPLQHVKNKQLNLAPPEHLLLTRLK